MTRESMIIVGGGVAGLATGCYAQMNGYRSRIFEMSGQTGGVCTSWPRGPYVLDSCIQWLMGTRPGSTYNQVWQELGALTGREVVNHSEFMRIEGRDGRTLIVYTDADQFEQQLRELAPADAAISHDLCEAIRHVAALDRSSGVAQAMHALRAVPDFVRWRGPTWQEFAARFTDRFVRDAIRSIFDSPDFPFLGGVFMLAWMHAGDAGYPIGGSLAFAQAIEQRYQDLGGTTTCHARVKEILIEDKRAAGVRLADGSEHRADIVVSAADGHTTVFDLLHSKFVSAALQRYYAQLPIVSGIVQVSLGVARDFTNEPHVVSFPLRTPVPIAGEVREQITVRHLAYDPTLAPAGHATLNVILNTDYARWAALVADHAAYEEAKHECSTAVIAALDERFPGLASAVEVVDVATPMTWEWSTGNWRGAFEGWLPTRHSMVLGMAGGMPRTLPGLSDFYMTGQWVVVGGGLPGVAPEGRALVKRLCREDGKAFVTTRASHPPGELLPRWPAEPQAAQGAAA